MSNPPMRSILQQWMRTVGGFLLLNLSVVAAPPIAPGYLARIGPSPIRFQKPPSDPGMPPELPPLVKAEANPAPLPGATASPDATLSAEFVGPLPQAPTQSSLPAPEPIADPVTASTQSAAPSAAVPTPILREMLSPQLLIPYFTGPQGGVSPSLLVPYPFTPPPPPERGTSRATYSVTP
jgi:hypothetical protein